MNSGAAHEALPQDGSHGKHRKTQVKAVVWQGVVWGRLHTLVTSSEQGPSSRGLGLVLSSLQCQGKGNSISDRSLLLTQAASKCHPEVQHQQDKMQHLFICFFAPCPSCPMDGMEISPVLLLFESWRFRISSALSAATQVPSKPVSSSPSPGNGQD